jgi:hypothetical protein
MRVDNVLHQRDEVVALAMLGIRRIKQIHQPHCIIGEAAELFEHRKKLGQ